MVSTFGNPVIWWSAIPALFYNIYLWQIRQDKIAGYLCISYASMLFPWLFIHRTVFIYQYFACSMIQILMLGNCLRFFLGKRSETNQESSVAVSCSSDRRVPSFLSGAVWISGKTGICRAVAGDVQKMEQNRFIETWDREYISCQTPDQENTVSG